MDLGPLAAALVCVPAQEVPGTVRRLLEHRIPVVECAEFHGERFLSHLGEIDHLARRFRGRAVVGAGWDPGIVSVFRGLFALLAPGGHSTTRFSPGRAVHHTLAVRNVRGVRSAVCLDVRAAEGKEQRYVYVELEPGASLEGAAAVLRADPLFAGEEIIVLPVDDVKALEDENRGIVIERYGTAAAASHQRFLLEARFDAIALSAEVMVAAARVVPAQRQGACSLFELPLGLLWAPRAKNAASWW
jgi:diaminopimelate dehydrogenase